MRNLVFAAALSFFGGSLLVALPLPCVPGTVASYEALGATGCTVGPLTFSLFTYSPVHSGPSGSPTDTQSQLQPLSNAQGFGFAFVPNLNTFFANPTGVSDAELQYVVSSTNGAPIINDVFTSVTGTVTNSSLIDIFETLCLGKATLPAGSCGSPGNTPLSFDTTIPGTNPQTRVFTATNFVAVNKDMMANSNPTNGNGGNLVISQVVNEWSVAVPEPGSVFLLVGGIAFLSVSGLLKRRRV